MLNLSFRRITTAALLIVRIATDGRSGEASEEEVGIIHKRNGKGSSQGDGSIDN